MIPANDGLQEIVLESPAGLSRNTARIAGGRVESITTRGEPAFVAECGLVVEVPHYGRVGCALVWSGAYFALMRAAGHGSELAHGGPCAHAGCGHAPGRAPRPGIRRERPSLGDVGRLPFVHSRGAVTTAGAGRYEPPSATYVHPGATCRSPTGTGTSARLA